ncbi:MAG: MotA/TolQ/ExbB proton channel family protein [Verrucomicrobiae bacterium]|nr:MotA/TolQ/ExbB proton channel family protein [Verrucomicrobiae bacterium]NNJ85609.1 MotA/TolQ/ExbB proton channel family protein [Akkermansiaceae bacterium]
MLSEFQQVLNQGGPILWGLIFLGVGLYSILASTWLGLRKVKRELAQHPLQGEGRREIIRQFATFELDRLAWVERRLPFIGVLAGAAPLAGLLGTVSGMLVTFSGLAARSVAAPIDKISVGISEALITTQAGLLIAIPAAFLLALLRKQTETTHSNLQQRLHRSLIEAH